MPRRSQLTPPHSQPRALRHTTVRDLDHVSAVKSSQKSLAEFACHDRWTPPQLPQIAISRYRPRHRRYSTPLPSRPRWTACTAENRPKKGAPGPAAPLRPSGHPAATAPDVSFTVTGCAIAFGRQVERNALKRAAVRRHASVRDHDRWYARSARSSPMSRALDDGDSLERR